MNLRGLQSGFTAGELSPKMLGQVDFAKYQFGCEILENFIVWPQGMASSRPGTRFVAAGKSPASTIRLIPFEFSTTQAYIIEAGHHYFRFYMNQGQILYGSTPYEIAHTYNYWDLFAINYSQSADILYLAHPSYPPRKLSRTGHTAWTIDDVAFTDGPYLEQKDDVTITPSATTGVITLTASGPLFSPYHVGAYFRLYISAAWGYVYIAAVTDAYNATAYVMSTLGGTGASTYYREGAWSPLRGYPSVVGFYENRLFWAANSHQPQTMWGSKTGDYYNHTPGSADADPLIITLNSDYVNTIKWMSATKVLLLGTSRGQWHVSASTTDAALTPSNIKASQETGLTSSPIFARSDHTVLFWQHFGRNLMEVVYSLESDSYVATPLTVLAEHIAQSPIQEMAYIQEPLGSLWCVRADGQIALLTYERTHKVVAWSRLVTDGYFESIAKIPGATRDEIWVLVRRTIDGNTVRYIELLENIENYENTSPYLFYVDSGLTYNGAPATTITGLSHLNGKTVSILADGVVQPSKTVAFGSIILEQSASIVQIGLPYTATMRPVRLEMKISGNTLQNRRQRVTTLGIRFYRSFAGKIGEDLDKLEVITFKTIGEPMNMPLTLFTGDKRIQFPGSYNRDGQVYIIQDLPLPMNLLSLMPRVDVQ